MKSMLMSTRLDKPAYGRLAADLSQRGKQRAGSPGPGHVADAVAELHGRLRVRPGPIMITEADQAERDEEVDRTQMINGAVGDDSATPRHDPAQ
jgi:hypothetical protein